MHQSIYSFSVIIMLVLQPGNHMHVSMVTTQMNPYNLVKHSRATWFRLQLLMLAGATAECEVFLALFFHVSFLVFFFCLFAYFLSQSRRLLSL